MGPTVSRKKMPLGFLSLNFQLSPKGLSTLQLSSKYAKKVIRFVFRQLQACVHFPEDCSAVKSHFRFHSSFLFFLPFYFPDG